MAHRSLADVSVGQIHRLVVEKASTITADRPLDELLRKIAEDPRTRHVYVVDKAGVLIGSVRLNSVLEHFFPLSARADGDPIRPIDLAMSIGAKTAGDIMNTNPRYVYESTSVLDMIEVMTEERVNELPVVDQQHKVIGEVNFLEVIASYLERQGG